MQAPSNQSLSLESDFHQWEFSELAHSELKLFFFLHNIFGTSDDCLLVYLRLEELPNMKKGISKTRLEETSERLWNTFKVVNFISQTSIVKRVQNMIRLEMDPGRIRNRTTCHVTINTFFQWMKCQLCKVIVSSSYYFCFLSRDNAFVWKVIKIELLISRHKQQCWAGATYNFRNKSDALIKALAILPDPTSRIQFKAFICLFEENLQILKYWTTNFQCQILLAWHSIWERANFPAMKLKHQMICCNTGNSELSHSELGLMRMILKIEICEYCGVRIFP